MPSTNNGIEKSARRKRPVISCKECHRRKEKCDRRQPCTRCIKRGKRNACLYEIVEDHVRSEPLHIECDRQSTESTHQTRSDNLSAALDVTGDESRLLGYATHNKGTAGIIHELGEITIPGHSSSSRNEHTSGQYAHIIRELPSPRHMDILVQSFFQNVAWHYDIVDEATFTNQLFHWRCLTHQQLQCAPDSLPTNLRSFPALLFQVLAQALLFQPRDHDETLDELKYAANMELSDRAADYSDAGHRLVSSFVKSEITLTTVQAELMRACFEKTTGAVTEAWHTLGTAIRDAQELGLHRLKPEPTLYLRNESPERDQGCKLWMMLTWPSSSAGRPRHEWIRKQFLYRPYIHDLERMDDCSLVVQEIHEDLLNNIATLPRWASPQRLRQGEPHWLSMALEVMFSEIHFVLFALHRPFVFVDSTNRTNAVYAATQILESQRRLFDLSEPLQYRAFTFVFSTFDAMVLIAAVHIRFPDEFVEQLPATIANFEEVLTRFEILQASNKLAGPAFKVLQRLYGKMLVITTPPQSSQPSSGSEEGDIFSGMGPETIDIDWNDMMPPDFANVLCPQPLNELMWNGESTTHLALQPEPVFGVDQSQFGLQDSF